MARLPPLPLFFGSPIQLMSLHAEVCFAGDGMTTRTTDNQQTTCSTAAGLIHRHDFGQGRTHNAEQRAKLVTLLTLATMVAEVFGGLITGSMALLADGIHMAGHAMALGMAAGAYYLARTHAQDRRLSLGSGKIADLAAYTSALLLAASTIWLVFESIRRLITPNELLPVEALIVASIGLIVNLVSAWVLAGKHEHGHGHGHQDHHSDSNLKAALMHVIADALTSVAAILGLIAAWLWGGGTGWIRPLPLLRRQ